MANLGNLWYQLSIKDMTAADLDKIQKKLENLGFKIDTKTLRQQIEAGIGATPFNATVTFGNARADLESIFLNKKYGVNAEVIASKLHDSINAALDKYTGKALIVPKRKDLRKAVNDALLSAGFEINIGKVKGLNATINNALGTAHSLKISVDPKKLADAIDKAVKSYKGNTKIPLEAKEKVLHDSIRKALKTEKFPIKVIVDKAEAQDAVRQALQAAGLQSRTGFTSSDKRAWDAQSRRMEAEARAAAALALAQRRLSGAHNSASSATDRHSRATVSLNSALRGNLTITKELGGAIGAAYSIVALNNFMKKVVDIGGELEQQKLAMKAILGDEGMANTISSQINTLAVKSPFGVMELNQYAKQLTAFQIPYNELYDTMKRMADVSAAVGVDMGRIILAYGQVRAAKFLKGTELRQFTEANIPMIDMLAQRFTKLKGEMVSAGDIMDMISKKEISFEDVKAVLWELTGEGGKFYNMQEVLSESVQAKWKNLADAVDLMFADIADDTSGPLKGMTELLTELTSRWKTIASMVSAAAISFGAVKVVSLLTARSLDASGTAALKTAANSALLERQNARLAQGYRTLTRDERKALGTSLSFWPTQKSMLASLSGAQFRQLALTGQISKEEWKRMIALGRLNDVQKKILIQTGVMSQTELNNIQVLKGWKRAFLGVGNAMRSVGRAMGTLFLNPMTLAMAAIGAATALWQRNSEEMQKAEEIGKNVATSASEGAKNLKASLETIKPSEGMSDTSLTQGIEQMQQLIKDYSPTPITDINDALVAQDGHVRTLIEQYEELRKKLNSLKDAYTGADGNLMGKAVEGALKATDGGNWFTQLFDDSLEENAKDFTNALDRVTDRIAKYSREYTANMKSAVNAAMNADKKFVQAVSGMESYEEKLRFLAEHAEDYYDAVAAFNADMIPRDYGKDLSYFSNAGQIKDAREELLKDTDKFIADYNARMSQMGITPALMTQGQKMQLAIALQSMLKQMEDVGEDAKSLMAQKMEEAWGLTGMIIEDKIGPSMQEKFRTLVSASTDESVKSAVRKLQYEGYAALSDAEKKLVDGLMSQAKTQTMTELGVINTDMQNYLKTHPLSQIITLTYVTATDAPSDLAKELAKQKGYPGLTESTNRYVVSWTKDNSVFNARNTAQAALQQAKNELDAAKKAGVGIDNAQKNWDEIWGAIQYLGWEDIQTKDQKSNKHTSSKGSQKDELAERLKQRFKDIKDAYAMFKEWAKLEGQDAAFKRVGASGLFSTLSPDKIPQTVEQYLALIDGIERELKAAGIKGKNQRESLANDLIKERFGINKDTFKEQLQIQLKEIDEVAKEALENFSIYDKILKSSGNKKLAMNIAFGMDGSGYTDFVKLQKDIFEAVAKANDSDLTFDTVTPDLLAKAPEEVRKAWEKANEEIKKYLKDQRNEAISLVEQYQTLAQKIESIEGKRQEDLKKAEQITDPERRQSVTDLINANADYEIFKQSDEYMAFFSALFSLTREEAENTGRAIEMHLAKLLQAGKLTIYEYSQEAKKVDEQLNKLRFRKSDFMTQVTGGKSALINKNIEEEQSKLYRSEEYQKALEKYLKAQAAYAADKSEANKKAAQAARTELDSQTQNLKNLYNQLNAVERQKDLFNYINNQAQKLSDTILAITGTAISFGADEDDPAIGYLNATGQSLAALSQGMVQISEALNNNDYAGVVAAAAKTANTIAELYNSSWDNDKAREIKESVAEAKKLQTLIDEIGRAMEHSLGHPKYVIESDDAAGAYGEQLKAMDGQLAELEKQRQLEIDKKKTDPEAVADYDAQIKEMQDQIKWFAEETAKDLYGIDLKDWASQLGDALYDAWKKGEDGAEAFKRKAGEILGDVMNNILKMRILEPMMQNVSDYLFGTEEERKANGGKGGAFGTDFELTPDEVETLASKIMAGMEGIDAYNSALDQLEKILNDKYGLSMKGDEEKSGLSAGIQSITENTADLLASYLNAVRSDVATQTFEHWPRLLNEALPQMNVIAESQLAAQRQIAENTLRNAIAAEAIMKSNDDISRLLVNVTQGGKRFYVN